MKSAAAQPSIARTAEDVAPVGVLTAVLWLGCVGVGALGFALPYARPRPAAPAASPVLAELIKVELTHSPAPAPANIALPTPSPTQPPPLFAPATPPQAPQLVAVALPSPTVAFALPIEAPARIVDVNQAAFVRPAPKPAPIAPSTAPTTGKEKPSAGIAPAPVVQTLTFGEGEGTQPAPRYPDTARRAGQEGTVVIRFTVGADGRVLAAEPSSPSPWGALNREAVRTVREQWRFKPGRARLCEVAIRFELKK
ncbi:MAG: energy transducer TonB [Limisphaerales bacterium]